MEVNRKGWTAQCMDITERSLQGDGEEGEVVVHSTLQPPQRALTWWWPRFFVYNPLGIKHSILKYNHFWLKVKRMEGHCLIGKYFMFIFLQQFCNKSFIKKMSSNRPLLHQISCLPQSWSTTTAGAFHLNLVTIGSGLLGNHGYWSHTSPPCLFSRDWRATEGKRSGLGVGTWMSLCHWYSSVSLFS